MPVRLAIFWLCVVACGVAHVGILRSVVRRSGEVPADVPRPRLVAEIVWAVIPMLALAAVLLATFPRVRQAAYGAPPMHDMGAMAGPE